MKESRFDGKLLPFLGWSIVAGLITSVTFGICFPWAAVLLLRWMASHTVIEGRRLRFDGTGGGLFGNWIKWLLLMIITFGIYGLWVPIKLVQWQTKHTHFADEVVVEAAE
ncbi:MAG: DUF898 family protein [Bacilli bacterium]